MQPPITLEYLLNKVSVDKQSGCWIWNGVLSRRGYGEIKMKKIKLYYAHRVSFYLHNGDFDRKLHVLHKCDVKRCVNPDHLYLGTNDDNNRDKIERHQCQTGVECHRAKLTEQEVLSIRKKYKEGSNFMKDLSNEYNVSLSAVSAIINRRNWRHI